MAGKVTDFSAITSPADDDVFYVVQVSDGTDKKITKASLSDDISADVQVDISGDFLETADFPSDSAWTTATSLDNGWTGEISYIIRAGVVTVLFNPVNGSAKTGTAMITLPVGYRPTEIIRTTLFNGASSDLAAVLTSGVIDCGGSANGYFSSLTYVVA